MHPHAALLDGGTAIVETGGHERSSVSAIPVHRPTREIGSEPPATGAADAVAAPGRERLAVGAVALALAAPIAAQTVVALADALLGVPRPPALALSAAAVLLALTAAGMRLHLGFADRLPAVLDGSVRRHPAAALAWALLAGAALIQTTRASVFMADPAETGFSVRPESAELTMHAASCAFVAAAHLRGGDTDLWSVARFPVEPRQWQPSRAPLDTRGFRADRFNYAPAMLLLTRPLLAISDDYLILRTLWFGIQSLCFGTALVAVALWIGGRTGAVALLLAPVVWLATPTRLSLQFGHFYPLALALGVGAMLAFATGRFGRGGVALAFAAVVRISPALLAVHLVAARRWRALAWTALGAAALVAATLLAFGTEVSRKFVLEQVPRLARSEATPPLEASRLRIADNLSVSGLALKLAAAGVADSSAAGRQVAQWAFALVALVLVYRNGRAVAPSRAARATAWLAALNAGALCTASAPATYVGIGFLWQATLVAAGESPAWLRVLAVAVLVAMFTLPAMSAASTSDLLLPLAAQVLGLALVTATLLRRSSAPCP